MDLLTVGAWVNISVIAITILLTAFGVFDVLAKYGGAGTFIPISGFANSIASCAIEYKKEGLVFGVGAKMFYVAGPVLVNGVAYSMLVGIVYFMRVQIPKPEPVFHRAPILFSLPFPWVQTLTSNDLS